VIGVIMLWAVCHWRREYFCEIYKLANPLFLQEHSEHEGGSTPSHLAGIKPRFDHLEQRLQSPFWLPTEPMDWVFSLFLAVNLGYIAVYWISTAEGFWFDCLFGLATLLAAACFWNLYLHLKATCGLFERLLRRLGQHAMVSAYERVPQRLKDKVAGQIFSAAPHAGDLDQAVRCLRRLAGHAATKEDPTIVTLPEVEQLQAEVVAIQAKLASALDLDRSKKEFVLAEAAEMNHHMAQIAGKHLVPSLLSYWDEKPVIEPKQSKKESGGNSSQETPQQLWLEEAETFVAIQVVHLIRQVFTHIQNLLTFLVLMLFWLLVCSESYPFVPHRVIQLSATWLVIWVLAAIIIFMVKFNRNEILSRINNTTPNRFTLDRSFMLTLITYVLIPAVGVLAVQFPPLGRILFGWLNNIRQLSGM
jgi:hypothetical protein